MPFKILHNAVRVRPSMPLLAGRVVESADTPAKREDYLQIQGLRLVKPYYFDFVCSVKKRWLGRTIIDVFSEEFASRPRSYYKEAFADGRLRIEGGKTKATADTPLHGSHRMRHFIHRHEPPVLDLPIQVVGETDDLIAVSKPASVPVHVCGQYRKNTVMALLEVERPDLGALHPVHRLDKPVSGLLLVAKNSAGANRVRSQIQDHQNVRKVYVARVLGQFPAQPVTADTPLAWDSGTNHAFLMEADGSMCAQQSLGQVPSPSARQTLQAKTARTHFRLLSVSADAETSLVECQPLTGRSHQIRVHLSALGYPIANDTQYGGTYKGPMQVRTHAAVKKREAEEQLAAETARASLISYQSESAVNKKQRCTNDDAQSVDALDGTAVTQSNQDLPTDAITNESMGYGGVGLQQAEATLDTHTQNPDDPVDKDFQVPLELQDDMCLNCPDLVPPGYPTDIVPLWLHARSYSCEDWSFQCPDPAWAGESWHSEHQFL